MGRKERKQELPFARSQEEMYRHNAEQALEKVQAVEPPINAARRAHNIARGELAERDARELLAIRLSTPAYVTRELGGEAERSALGSGMGSRRHGHPGLPPRAGDHRHHEGAWRAAEDRDRPRRSRDGRATSS
jgi:hypothetical protein